jgi:transcriptional regulator with XRE-family HTH domain
VGISVSATTTAERFAAWLAAAMRRAGLDIDSQQGGGRAVLAEEIGVSRSTVTRWLQGQTLPSPDQFEPLARALDTSVEDVLVGGGIVSVESLWTPGVQSPAASAAALADQMSVPASRREDFITMVELLGRMARHSRATETFPLILGLVKLLGPQPVRVRLPAPTATSSDGTTGKDSANAPEKSKRVVRRKPPAE